MPTVRLRRGDAEVEISDDSISLDEATEKAAALLRDHLPASSATTPTAANGQAAAGSIDADISINTAIARLGGGTCKEVMTAAAALLGLRAGNPKFTRSEWDTLAESASQWKSAYVTQKSTIIGRLVSSGYIIENSKGVYSLSVSARKDLEARLAVE